MHEKTAKSGAVFKFPKTRKKRYTIIMMRQKKHHLSLLSRSEGMTILETVILMGMITAVSATVLISFTGLNEGIALNRAARELTLGLRKAQQIALAVKQVPGSGSPPRAGIRLSSQGNVRSRYSLFADLDDLNSDGKPDGNFNYNAPPDTTVEQVTFGRGVVVSAFQREDGSAITPISGKLNILFSAPEAQIDFSDKNGAKITSSEPYLSVILQSPDGKTKKVIIRISGQIEIQ